MHEKFTTRLEVGLGKMQAAAEAGRRKDEVAAGERLGPRTLLYDLAKMKSGDIVRPAETHEGVEKLIRLRQVTEPDEAQWILLHRLGISLPRRLNRCDELVQM